VSERKRRALVCFGAIAAVLLTHYHCDHALSEPWFQERGVPIMASAHTADIMERGDRKIWYEHPELVRPCPVVHVLSDGEGLEHDLVHMVYLRVSQINGCAYCVDLHYGDAVSAGVDRRKLNSVVTWQESPFFSDRERAAFHWQREGLKNLLENLPH